MATDTDSYAFPLLIIIANERMTAALNLMMRKLIFILFATCLLALSAAVPEKKGVPVPKPVDIPLLVDSALIMADNYAEAIANKPEIAKSRMNALKRFHASYAGNKPVGDSISNSLFDVYVDNIERGNLPRANAFKDCFLAVADKSNEHLGPLYAAELEIAQERNDTLSIKKNLSDLVDYARCFNYDYDDVISKASDFLSYVRNRPALRDVLPGVWVSEEIADYEKSAYLKDNNYFDDCKLLSSLRILSISDRKTYDSSFFWRCDSVTGLDFLKWKTDGESKLGNDQYKGIANAMMLPAWNMEALSPAYIEKCVPNDYDISDYGLNHACQIVLDDTTYSAYAFWGDEKLKRNNAEIGAILRQTTQQIQASVAGELSRSNYKTVDRLTGNLAAGLIGAGINSAIDALMVSKSEIWSMETTLHVINPYCLEAESHGILIVSKSNSPKPEITEKSIKTRYYRWEPSDSVIFVGTLIDNTADNDGIGGAYFCHDVPKDEIKDFKVKRKTYEDNFKAWYKKAKKDLERKLKTLDKHSDEYKRTKEELTKFTDYKTQPRAWASWNKESLSKLKAKSDNYRP